MDEPTKRQNVLVVTTVDEKLEYFENTHAEFMSNLLTVEKTNASGTAKATLEYDGVNFGELTSLELLRLKNLLGELKPVYENIPVRDDKSNWVPTNQEEYSDRTGIFETELQKGVSKSTLKEQYIMPDPNVQYLKDSSRYTPQLGSKDTIIDLGDYTLQTFSGEWTHRQRAAALARLSGLAGAVIEALKKCNEAEEVKTEFDPKKLFALLRK
jgi:hypothetical protein